MSSARRIKLRVPAPKPRNPVVVGALLRKAGSHRKSSAAQRHAQNMALARALREGGE